MLQPSAAQSLFLTLKPFEDLRQQQLFSSQMREVSTSHLLSLKNCAASPVILSTYETIPFSGKMEGVVFSHLLTSNTVLPPSAQRPKTWPANANKDLRQEQVERYSDHIIRKHTIQFSEARLQQKQSFGWVDWLQKRGRYRTWQLLELVRGPCLPRQNKEVCIYTSTNLKCCSGPPCAKRKMRFGDPNRGLQGGQLERNLEHSKHKHNIQVLNTPPI